MWSSTLIFVQSWQILVLDALELPQVPSPLDIQQELSDTARLKCLVVNHMIKRQIFIPLEL